MTEKEYQREFVKILKQAFEEIKPFFSSLLKRMGITFEDIASVAYVESSFGVDTRLLKKINANPFQVYHRAFQDALAEAKELNISTVDAVDAFYAYSNPQCTEVEGHSRISLDLHRKHLKGILKVFLLYIHRIATNYADRIPQISFCNSFEKLMLTYHIGPFCAKLLENTPFERWDEVVSKCLNIRVSPTAYLQRLREGKMKVKAFFEVSQEVS